MGFDLRTPETQKLLLAGVLFLVIGSPQVYSIVNNIFSPLGIDIVKDGEVTIIGLAIHTLVFLILFYFLSELITK